MELKKIIIGLLIHLVVPLVGLLCFINLKRKMKNENIEKSLIFQLLIIFATYGGLLIILLTTLFWEWSGLASLGTFYLVFCAPLLMVLIAQKQRKVKINSKYNKLIYYSGILYFIIAPLMFTILFLIIKN